MEELEGCFNPTADKVERVDKCWSDTNLDKVFTEGIEGDYTFDRLKCRNCGGISFEVLSTDDWEISARCLQCGMYYIVHTG